MRNRTMRFLSIILMCSVLVGACGIGMVNASDEGIVVSADPITVQAGNQFEVPIRFSGGQGIMGFSVSFTYDETAMKPVSVFPASGIGGGWENSIETAKNNTFSVVWYGTENMTAQGTVFTVTFQAVAHAAGDFTIRVGYDQASTFNEAWQDVVLRTGAIDVHIDNAHPSPEFLIPEATVSAGEEYACNVYVRNNTGFGVVSFAAFFDATALTPKEILPGIGSVLSSNVNGPFGTVQIILDQVSANSGDGVLFTILFQTSDIRQGTFPISMTNSSDYTCKSGSVTLFKDMPTGVPTIGVQQNVRIENNIVTVPICISNNTGVMGMRLQATVDSTKFCITDCERAAAFPGGLFDYTYHADTGTAEILWSSSEASYINDTCCVLTIQITDESADVLAIAFDYKQEDTFDESMKDVALSCENAEIPLHRLEIHSDASSINVGETLQLSASMLYAENQPEITWRSGNTEIAAIDETGLVHGVRRGMVNITAEDGNGHTATIAIQILPIRPELQLISYDGSFDQKIDWWKRYSSAQMTLGFIAYKCDEVTRFEWSSDSSRVHIDQQGNITNTGCFARSAKITLAAYDADGSVIASSAVTVRFYKFNWQYRRLQSQEIVSDNVFRPTVEPSAAEPETLFSFVTAFLSKAFWPFIR